MSRLSGWLLIGIAVLPCALGCNADTLNRHEAETEAMRELRKTIASVAHASESAKPVLAARLSTQVEGMLATERERIQPSDVDAIAALLGEDNIFVRYHAASTLGAIGPRALRAIPALEAAISRIEEEEKEMLVRPAVSGRYPMYSAIHRISGRPIPDEF